MEDTEVYHVVRREGGVLAGLFPADYVALR
jgi:hypothetical protein